LGIIKKQAFQSSVLLYTGTIIGFLTAGLLTPNLLLESEIGTLKLIQSYATIFMSLGILGFSTITIRYIPRFLDTHKNNHNGFFGILLIVGLVGCTIVFFIINGIKPTIIENNLEKSTQFAQYYFLIIPLTFFLVFYTLFDTYNNALYRSSYGVFLRDFVQRIIILVGLVLVLFNFFDFDLYLYYYVAAFCIPTLLMLIHLFKHKAVDIHINFNFLKKPLVTSMASVGLFGLLNNFGAIAVIQIDTIMINMYVDSAAVGIYAITFYFGTLVLVPSRALNKIAPSIIAKAYKEKDMDTVKDIYYRSSGNLFLIGVLILLGLLVNLDNVFNIIPRSYEDGKYVILFIGLANLVKMAGGSNDSIITFSKYYKITTVFLILLISFIVILNFIFIPAYGMTGAAVASLLAILIYNLAKFIFIKIKFGFNPYNFQFLVVLVCSAIIYTVILVLPDIHNFIVEIIIDSIITTLLFYLSIKYLPIASDLNLFIKQVLQKATSFFRSKIK
jgi:O-antigen/teichoic acid export membrane protein